jgi:hypothetical protein
MRKCEYRNGEIYGYCSYFNETGEEILSSLEKERIDKAVLKEGL